MSAIRTTTAGRSYRNAKGFTLVEILIVVIILGILAAIVIPQFTNASQNARQSSLASTLQTLRSQIQLYKMQHGDVLPNIVATWTPMTGITAYGVPSQNFGPYMQAAPINPMNGSGVVLDSAALPTTQAASACGFVYDYNSGNGSGHIYGTDTDSKTIDSY